MGAWGERWKQGVWEEEQQSIGCVRAVARDDDRCSKWKHGTRRERESEVDR